MTVTRTWSVWTVAAKGIHRYRSLLPVTVACTTHPEPSQVDTVKSVGTPSTRLANPTPDRVVAVGAVTVSVSGNAPAVSSFQNVARFWSMAFAAS